MEEDELRLRGQRRRLRGRIVAGHQEHATLRVDAADIGVADGVARAVDAGRLAVPHAENTVVAALEVVVGELCTPHGGGAEVFVEAWQELDVVGIELRLVRQHERVDPAQRRTPVAAHHGSVVETISLVGAELIEEGAQQRLHSRHRNIALLQSEPILEFEFSE